jgi:hypothetical protein
MKYKLKEQEGLIVQKGNESLDLLDVAKTAARNDSELFDEAPSYVDLGLPSGLLWATCNVGAKSPEEAGLYFSWGNVEGHTPGANSRVVSVS